MEIKIAVIVQAIFFIAMLYGLYRVSEKNKMSSFTKWLIVCACAGVLIFSDKVKMIAGLILIGIVLCAERIINKRKTNEANRTRLDR